MKDPLALALVKRKNSFDLGGNQTSEGRSNPEVVGSIPTEVKIIFSLPRVVP